MGIQDEINRIGGNVGASLDALSAKGVDVPEGANSNDLATLIASVPTGGGGIDPEQLYELSNNARHHVINAFLDADGDWAQDNEYIPLVCGDGGDTLRVVLNEPTGVWADAARDDALTLRFTDGTEAKFSDLVCDVPFNKIVNAGSILLMYPTAYSLQDNEVVSNTAVGTYVRPGHEGVHVVLEKNGVESQIFEGVFEDGGDGSASFSTYAPVAESAATIPSFVNGKAYEIRCGGFKDSGTAVVTEGVTSVMASFTIAYVMNITNVVSFMIMVNGRADLAGQTFTIHEMPDMYVRTLADAMVRPDWNESDPTSPAYIRNKPGGLIHHAVSGTGVNAYKNAYGVVTIKIDKSYSSLTQWSTVEMTTLPEEFWPPVQMAQTIFCYAGGGNVPVSLRVTETGVVNFVPYASTTSASLADVMTYVAKA